MSFITFDIETATEFPDDGVMDHAALGISCAATYKSGNFPLIVPWAAKISASGLYGPRLIPKSARSIAQYLSTHVFSEGRTLVTWNGHFDLQILAHECKDPTFYNVCQRLALGMVDPMFQFLTEQGYCVGLEKVSLGMGGASKSEGLHGDLAPVMWKESREAQEKVLTYVQGDVTLTADVYRKLLDHKQLCWITSKGNRKCVPFPPCLPWRSACKKGKSLPRGGRITCGASEGARTGRQWRRGALQIRRRWQMPDWGRLSPEGDRPGSSAAHYRRQISPIVPHSLGRADKRFELTDAELDALAPKSAAVQALVDTLQAVEWVQGDDPHNAEYDFCPWCGGWKKDGHAGDCQRRAVLGKFGHV